MRRAVQPPEAQNPASGKRGRLQGILRACPAPRPVAPPLAADHAPGPLCAALVNQGVKMRNERTNEL